MPTGHLREMKSIALIRLGHARHYLASYLASLRPHHSSLRSPLKHCREQMQFTTMFVMHRAMGQTLIEYVKANKQTKTTA